MKSVLDNPVLVLNKNWRAVATCSVRTAIVLMSRDSAKGLCIPTFRAYTWDEWTTDIENPPQVSNFVSRGEMAEAVPAPEAIILSKYSDVHRRSVRFTTKNLYKRDGFICQYCYKGFSEDELSVDHVIPRAKKGKTTWTNCVTACFWCNNRKGDSLIEDIGYKLLKKPERPKWSPIVHVREDLRLTSWKNLVSADDWHV